LRSTDLGNLEPGVWREFACEQTMRKVVISRDPGNPLESIQSEKYSFCSDTT
jgi:hypothetical protein